MIITGNLEISEKIVGNFSRAQIDVKGSGNSTQLTINFQGDQQHNGKEAITILGEIEISEFFEVVDRARVLVEDTETHYQINTDPEIPDAPIAAAVEKAKKAIPVGEDECRD